jgi:hypothetical protein
MKKWTIRLLKLALVLVALLGALVGYMALDEAPPQDADILPVRTPLPEAENGFAIIDIGESAVVRDPAIDREALDPFTQDWNSDLARPHLEKNRAILERWDRFFEKGKLQVPELTSLEAPIHYLMRWRVLMALASMRVAILLEDGKGAEALGEAVKIARFGEAVEGSGGSLIVFLVGCAVRAVGTLDAIEAVKRGKIPADEARPALEDLRHLRADRLFLAEALRCEYRCFGGTIDDICDGKPFPSEPSLDRIPGILRRHVLKRNATKALYAETFRGLIRDAAALTPPDPGKSYVVDVGSPWWPPRNPVGKVIYGFAGGYLGPPLLAKAVSAEILPDFARLAWALGAFREARGELPASLGDLVPAYLDAVPLDPFDGKPLRYSKEKGIVWSVGRDRADSGGSDNEDDRTALTEPDEPTLRIKESR